MKNIEDTIDNKYYEFHPNYKHNIANFIDNKKNRKLDYGKYLDNCVSDMYEINTLFFDFDNRARLFKPNRLDKATVCINNSYENVITYINKLKNNNTQMVLLNAWNEWGEKMHIEPSKQKYTYYLDLINKYL